MPIEQTAPPTLTEVHGGASKQMSTGVLGIEIVVTPGASGWPPIDEMNAALLELFNVVGSLGWVGSLSQRYVSEVSLTPDPPANLTPAP